MNSMENRHQKKSPLRFAFLAMAAVGVYEILGNLAARFLYLAMPDPFLTAAESASIGIIGGADGPTAVFVATPGWTHWIVPVLLLVIGIFGFIRLSRCKQE